MHTMIKRMCKHASSLCILVLLFITVASLYSTTTKTGFRTRAQGTSEVRVQSDEELGSLPFDLYNVLKVGLHVPLNNHVPIQQDTGTTSRELQVSRPEKQNLREDESETAILKEHTSMASMATVNEETNTNLNRQTDSMAQAFSPVHHQEEIVDKLGNLLPHNHKHTNQSMTSVQQIFRETQVSGTGGITTDEKTGIARKGYPSVIVVPKGDSRKQVLPATQKISTPTPAPQQKERGGGSRVVGGGRKGGYVLAEDFWEQQMSASRNLQSLQCWAGLFGLRVVEPFVIDSVFKTYLNVRMNDHYRQFLRFHDLLDLQYWNFRSKALHHAELVSWEEFLHHAPREAIVVDIKYQTHEELEAVSNKLPRSQRYKVGCKKGTWSKQAAFLQQTEFNITRMVCFNFKYGDILSMDEFNQHIFAGQSPQNVTVIFKTWRGLRSSGRITVEESHCHKPDMQFYAPLSPKVTQITEEYKTKYLHGSDYIAVMARIEKSKINFRREGIVTYCLNQIIQHVNALRATSGIERVFLSIDMGEFGSNSFRNTGDSTDLNVEFTKFFTKLYGNTTSVSQWSKTFTNTASTSDAGYIAVLQKSIAIHAKCIIFVGGGLFQNHAVHLYKTLHPRREQQCIRTITDCTREKYS